MVGKMHFPRSLISKISEHFFSFFKNIDDRQ